MIKNKKGFVTLIELLLSIVLFSIIFIFLIQIYLSHSSQINFQKSQINVDIASRSLLDEIGSKLREGKLVLPQTIIGSQTYITNSQTVVVQVPSVDSSGVAISSSSDILVFTNPSGTTQLREIISPDSSSSRKAINHILSNNVLSLNFAYNNTDLSQVTSIDIEMNSFEVAAGSQKVSDNKTSITLRNK